MVRTTISELADDEVYTSLQQRLEHIKTSPKKTKDRDDGIVSLLELTARVQGRLFEALHEEGVDDHKVIPLMANGRLGIPSHRVSGDTELKLVKENLDKSRELDHLKRKSMLNESKLEEDLAIRKAQARAAQERAHDLESKLDRANKTLDITELRLNKTENELKDTRVDNSLLRTAPAAYLSKYYPSYYPSYYNSAYYDRYYPYYYKWRHAHLYPYYDHHVDREYYRRKYDAEYARIKTDLLLSRYAPTKPVPVLAGVAEVTNDSRRRRLIDRYAELFTNERLEVCKALRTECHDEDTIKRIIYVSVVEAFRSAQRLFREQRRRARNILSSTTVAPILEPEIMDYMVRNKDMYDPESTLFDVIRALETNPTMPKHINYRKILRHMVTEIALTAYEMGTTDPELDIECAVQGEVFSDAKYRRTFDSEFGAPLVAAHLWPPLVNGDNGGVVLKGEAATRHSVFSPVKEGRKSRSAKKTRQARSASPVRGRSTVGNRSKSPVKF